MVPTVTSNKLVVASKKTGTTTLVAFPDVCLTPAWPAPAPLPYPGVSFDWRASQTKAPPVSQKVAVIKGSRFMASAGGEPGTGRVSSKQRGDVNFTAAGANVVEGTLRSLLSRLHNDMMVMRGDNPELWHAAIDNYVRLVAELYKNRASS